MSTPTSRDPDERPTESPIGQHAAPRPNPPSPDSPAPLPPPRSADLPPSPPGPPGPPSPPSQPGQPSQPPRVSSYGSTGEHTAAAGTPARPATTGETTVMPVAPPSPGAPSPGAGAPPAGVATGATGQVEARTVEERELPERPKKPGFGRHLLGVLLGLVLTPVALLLTGIGTARLADVAGSGDPLTDVLGITLLIIGVLLLAVVVLLGAWTPAVPITGGLVWGIGVGLAFLVVPGVMEETLEAMSADSVVPGGIEQLAESAMSGHLLVTGTLLVAAGIAAARARRRGRRWAEGVAAADAARLDTRAGRRTA